MFHIIATQDDREEDRGRAKGGGGEEAAAGDRQDRLAFQPEAELPGPREPGKLHWAAEGG